MPLAAAALIFCWSSIFALRSFSDARGDRHRDPRAFAVPDQRDALLVDVLALPLQPAENRAYVFGRIGDGRRFRAAAALPGAALVIPDHQKTRIDELAGKLPEHRDTRDKTVAIDRT